MFTLQAVNTKISAQALAAWPAVAKLVRMDSRVLVLESMVHGVQQTQWRWHAGQRVPNVVRALAIMRLHALLLVWLCCLACIRTRAAALPLCTDWL